MNKAERDEADRLVDDEPVDDQVGIGRLSAGRGAHLGTSTAPASLLGGMPDGSDLVINVDLPAPVRSAPADEVAVAIDEISVDPVSVGATESLTTSISVIPVPLSTNPIPVPAVIERDLTPEFSRAAERATSRREGRPDVQSGPESASMLTPERLLVGATARKNKPEGRWPEFVWAITFHLVNLGDSAAVRERKEIDARIHKAFDGGTRFVPVLTRKGGVGKTTVTTLLGMALSSVREDRVIAIDANPDRGTLAERINKQTRSTVRDVVTKAASVTTFNDFSNLISRDETRLDVLASDTDPMLSEAFSEDDYNVVADLCARYYSIALTDCGTGIVHSVMRATLQRADSVVIVSGGSVDEARLASETLTWLESNGYGHLVKNAIVAINTATQGTNLVKLEEIEAHFVSRVRAIVRIPYDPMLAAGSVINYDELRPLTREAARDLAALVVDGLPTSRTA